MKLLIVLAAILVSAYADNRGCPHVEFATKLLHEGPVLVENDGPGVRQTIRLDVDELVIRDEAVSCIYVVAANPETSPGYIGAGRNRDGGISVVLSSKLGQDLEAILYIYSSGDPDVQPDVQETANKSSNIEVSYFKP